MREQNFWVIGGDLRQLQLARLLREDGHEVHTYGLEGAAAPIPRLEAAGLAGVERADCIILPLPALGEDGEVNAPFSRRAIPLEELLDRLRTGQTVCAGRADARLRGECAARGLVLEDYFAREELTVANAVSTAEGAVQIAMEELPITLRSARVLVLGYGRVGKLTAHRMAALGADVTVAARSWEQQAWAVAWGHRAEPLAGLAERLLPFDLVVNTVPAPVLGTAELAGLKEDGLVLDLASRPGGVDAEAAAKLGRRVIWALSLPGKVAPATAGRDIKEAICHILRERGA